MKPCEEPPDLTTLRRLFGHPIPPDSPRCTGKQIRPSHWRKTYQRAPSEQYRLRARRVLSALVRELLPPDKIAPQVDKRPLLQLLDQRDELMGQILARAATGDEQAISLMISTARGTVRALDDLEKCQFATLKAKAETYPDWPVFLSNNRADIDRAIARIDRLNVGPKAATPRRRGQKLDPQSFWTKLAAVAFEECQDIRVVVPALEHQCAGTRPHSNSRQFWETTIRANFYWVSPTDCIMIADWERQCVSLSLPVTRDNLKQWWTAIKHCVLEHWHEFSREYEAALKQIGHGHKDESQRRNMAVDRLEQAFRDLVGLR